MDPHFRSSDERTCSATTPLSPSHAARGQGQASSEVQREISDMPQVAGVIRKDLVVAEFRRQTADSMSTSRPCSRVRRHHRLVGRLQQRARIALHARPRAREPARARLYPRRNLADPGRRAGGSGACGDPSGALVRAPARERRCSTVNDPEAFRFPAFVSHHTYAFAALVTAVLPLAAPSWCVASSTNST